MSLQKCTNAFWSSELKQYLNRERYSPQATQRGIVVNRDFLSYLRKAHIAVELVRPSDIQLYLKHALRLYRRHHGQSPESLNSPKSEQWWRYSHTTSIYMLLRLVHGHWPLPPPPKTPAEIFQREVCEEYDKWMADVRGLSQETRSDRCAEAKRFLDWRGERGSPQGLPNTTAQDIDAYMVMRARSLRRTTLKTRAVELRSFLRYLHATSRLLLEPSTSVIIPRLYAFESIPSALRAEEIKLVVEMTCKDRSPKGLRDLAILRLLTSYGLRAGEVTALRLEDMGWRNDTLRIRHSKTSAYSELPLLPAVGNAILDYLRKGRPKTLAREIFIRTCAPYRAFKNGSCLHRLVELRLNAAGIEPQGRRGPHAFRHARALSLLNAAVPTKEIGDILGHRCAHSANAYLKLASEDLRAVGLEIPVGVNA